MRERGSGGGGCASLAIQMVKYPPAMWETWVRSLGQDDLLEEGMAMHSSVLAWRIPMNKGAWRAIVHEVAKESDMAATKYSTAHEREKRGHLPGGKGIQLNHL